MFENFEQISEAIKIVGKKKTIKGKNFINWKISTKNIKYKKQEKIEIETLEKKNQV